MSLFELKNALIKADLNRVKELLTVHPEWIECCDEEGVPSHLHGARSGDLQMIRYIAEYTRASLSTTDGMNRDMLHYAAQSGSVESCKYLVERCGLSVCRGDITAVTPYEIAKACAHQELVAYFQTVAGASLDEMYHNPIRRGMFPDPSIVRVGSDYYMVNSSFVYFPCIPISHSTDLIHWDIIGHAITNPDWSMLGELDGGRGYWAPDISYCDGLFYICATYRMNDGGSVCRKQIVVTSKQPQGPYSKPWMFDEDGIDPSIFHDDDGRHYMLLNRGARIFEINQYATEQMSEAVMLYYGDCKRAPEGPHLLKKDGYYYLFLAEGGTGPGHRETVARSKTLHGIYEPCPYNPILRQWDEKALIQRCGHAKPFCTQNGDWYMVYLCGRALDSKYTMLGRETSLDPITWTADGWPLVNGGRGPSDLQVKPMGLVPSKVNENKHAWMTPREPMLGQIQQNAELITIVGSDVALSDVKCRSLLVRRQTAFEFSFSFDMKFEQLPLAGEAGLTCYYDEHSFFTFGVTRRDDILYVSVCEQIGDEVKEHDPIAMTASTEDTIKMMVHADGLTRHLAFAFAGGELMDANTLTDVTYLSDEGVRIGKRFTGAMVGLYATGRAKATFSNIIYHEGA